MKRSTVLVVVAMAVLLAGVVGIGGALAQCGTAAGCGNPDCAFCAANASKSSCSTPAVSISLDQLTPDELKLVKHLADLIEADKRVEFNIPAFAKATTTSTVERSAP